MVIGGLQKFSMLDYPDQIAAIIFTQGCNFRCQFCYNPMLVVPGMADKFANTSEAVADEDKKGFSLLNEEDLFYFLENRAGKLDAVVITGGEPTLHPDLPEFLKKIQELGYKIKLDTNGTNPEMITKLIKSKLVDYLAMDIKAPVENYEHVTGVPVDLTKIRKSVKIVIESGLPYEFRSTIVPGLHDTNAIQGMGKIIEGAEKWYLQFFKSNTNLVNKNLETTQAFADKEMEDMRKQGGEYVNLCLIR